MSPMKFLQGLSPLQLITFFASLSLFLVVSSSVQILELSQSKEQKPPKTDSEIKLKINDPLKPEPKPIDEGSNVNGCTITKNGQTEQIATNSVHVNEKSKDGVNLNVDCKSGSSGSNNSSNVKTNVDVEVNTGN